MRTRTRTNSVPTLCAPFEPCIESFTDDPSPARVWKPCSHNSVKVVEFVNPSVIQTSDGFVDPPGGLADARIFPNGGFNTGRFYGWADESHPSLSPAEFEAISLDKVAMDCSRSSLNLAEMIATYKETVKLFSKPARFLDHATRMGVPVSRRPLKELRHALDSASKTWLAGTYGYLPLISSLKELVPLCTRPRESMARLKVPLKKDIRQATSSSGSSQRLPDTPARSCTLHVEVEVQRRRLVQVTGDINPTFFAMNLANQLATYLGLNDFGRTAWELVPYSFVVDWFTNVGKVVANASGMNGHLAYCNLRASSAETTITRTKYQAKGPLVSSCTAYWQGIPYTLAINVSGGVCVVERKQFVRSAFGDADLSGSWFNTGLSSYRTATSAALLLGQLGRLASWKN